MALINCPECNRQVSNQAKTCPHCGIAISEKNDTANLKNKFNKKNVYAIIIIFVVAMIGLYLHSYIQNEIAEKKAEEYLQEKRRAEIEWEIEQSAIRDEIQSDLIISDVDGYSNDKIKGKLTNNSSYTVSYVKVKFVFKKHNEIVDTDWTYAVSAEGLAPGETTEFYTYNDNWSKNITATVIDFDY